MMRKTPWNHGEVPGGCNVERGTWGTSFPQPYHPGPSQSGKMVAVTAAEEAVVFDTPVPVQSGQPMVVTSAEFRPYLPQPFKVMGLLFRHWYVLLLLPIFILCYIYG